MKHLILFSVLFSIISCGSPAKKQQNIIETDTPNSKKLKTEKPLIPKGAISGKFNGDNAAFYSYVKNVDLNKGVTTIAFENDAFPEIFIPKSYGATLDTLKLKGISQDILFATVKLKDTNFNKYFLYRLKNNQWKPVVNGFAIHKSHRPDTLRPIRIDPQDSTKVIRYYSVFDLDSSSESSYMWKLLQETIPIENN